MVRYGHEAANHAMQLTGHSGYCEQFTRTAFGFPARYGSAMAAYRASAGAGPIHMDKNPPVGAVVYFSFASGPNKVFGHVAIVIGNGGVIRSTSINGKNPGTITIDGLLKKWANVGIKYLGWAEYYHGIKIAAPHQTVPPSSSTGTLKRGSKGAAVGVLQRRLNRDYPAYSNLMVDEDFGALTEKVVKEFQRRAGLYVDGIAGPITLRALGL